MLSILYPTNIDKDTVQGLIRLVGQANTENGGNALSAGVGIEFYNKWNGGGSNEEYSIGRISGRASQGYDGGLQFDVSDNSGPGQTNFTTAMTILKNTFVGIGTTSPSTLFHIYKASFPILTIQSSSYQSSLGIDTTSGNLVLNNESNAPLSFNTNATERMRITSGGDVLVNSTSNTLGGKLASTLNDNGYAISALKQGTFGAAILARVDNTNSDFCRFWYSSSNTQVGSINTNGTTTSYNVTSDYRLKQDFKQFNGLDLVSKIKVYDYAWKVDNSRMNGVIAHELQEVVPYAVTGEKDAEEMQQVDYSKLVPI